MLDLNIVVLAGRLAAPPEIRTLESGTRLARYLMTITSAAPNRRVDVVPVTLWSPNDSTIAACSSIGSRLYVAGTVQRRFWKQDPGRRSRLEVVAQDIQVRDEPAEPEHQQ